MGKSKNKKHPFLPKDPYGVLGQELEVDTDVNEDRFREFLLDQSVATFIENTNRLKNEE
ncbi:hypothetical protein [Ammoniphilus sp. 3BR4]|uniref:hypothetical protein n=1 Tax=Ammoniphilus sp. 3BR4 TaxID=3158265 RepID=UPI00346736CC